MKTIGHGHRGPIKDIKNYNKKIPQIKLYL
jgi:hypothetical protein